MTQKKIRIASASSAAWLCCQLGAREHYAVPRALQLSGLLGAFITDLWVRPGTLLHSWKKRLTGRFHPGLAGARIAAPNLATLRFERSEEHTSELQSRVDISYAVF